MLTLSVYNDGPKLKLDNGEPGMGTGIFNLRSRLSSLYGHAFNLTIRNQEPSGVEVSVSVPLREN
jgi:LytS/YehU family sensor histidine kinase